MLKQTMLKFTPLEFETKQFLIFYQNIHVKIYSVGV